MIMRLRLLFRKPATDWKDAEELAARYLRRQGYSILHRNLRLDRFELDIVARKGDTVVFVEVRSRKDDGISAPEETIRYTKRQHLRAAARRYMARYGEPETNYRFDVIGVLTPPKGEAQVNHIEYAFTMEE